MSCNQWSNFKNYVPVLKNLINTEDVHFISNIIRKTNTPLEILINNTTMMIVKGCVVLKGLLDITVVKPLRRGMVHGCMYTVKTD